MYVFLTMSWYVSKQVYLIKSKVVIQEPSRAKTKLQDMEKN